MARLFYHVMQDNAGNLLFDVSGTMRIAGSGTLATIYGDEALTVILPNPMTNHASFGSFKCFLGAGDYDFYMAKSGYTFETLTGVQGHGTMAQQDHDAVAITGGAVIGLSVLGVSGGDLHVNAGAVGLSTAPVPGQALTVGSSPSVFHGQVAVGGNTATSTVFVHILHPKASHHGVIIRPSDADAGGAAEILFQTQGGASVGSITSTGSATAYNTSSDARLKTAVQTLVGELAVIRALRPVRFRWLADDSEGVGFLAQELAEHVHGVVTGEPDAVEEDGVTIRPQMIDHSKLVVWLVGALQTVAGQVETLSERVQNLEQALGI